MAFHSGLAYQMTSPVAESTYGVAPALTGAKFFTAPSETMKLEKTVVQGTSLWQNKQFPMAARRVPMAYKAGGSLPLELAARGLQQWLQPMFGSYGQTPATLTLISSAVYGATHAPGTTDGSSFSFQIGKPTVDGVIEPFTYTGCKISEWEIACARNEIAKLNLTIVGRNELAGSWVDPLSGSVPSLATYAEPAAAGVFTWIQGSVLTGGTVSTTSGVTSVSGGTAAGNILSMSVKAARALDSERWFDGNAGFISEPVQNGLMAGSGEIDVEWLSTTGYLSAFQADTPVALQFLFTGPVIGGALHSLFELIIPEAYWDDGSPQVPGPQVVTQKLPFTFTDDNANNVVQATYQTLDTS